MPLTEIGRGTRARSEQLNVVIRYINDLVSSGQLGEELERFGVYNVVDHGLVEGNSSGLAAANGTALEALWVLVAEAGGGEIRFPPGTWSLPSGVDLNHDLGAGNTVAITLCGTSGASLLKFWGTTGPFLNIATNAASPIARCGLRDLYILRDDVVTAGSTIRAGYTSRWGLENVYMMNGGLIGLELIEQASFFMRDSTIIVQDTANAACIQFGQSIATGGAVLLGCDLSGGTTNSRGILFSNSALFDTVLIANTSIKDHYIGIVSGGGVGDVANVLISNTILDASQYNVVLAPVTGADYYGWLLSNCWMSGAIQNVQLSSSNGGTIQNVRVSGGFMGTSTQGAILLVGGIVAAAFDGVTIATDTNNASYPTVEIEDVGSACEDVSVTNCRITAGPLCPAVIRAAVATDSLNVIGNQLRGGADADGIDVGATSASRVVSGNSWRA